MNKIKTIIRKEWAEVFKNRLISTMIFLPLLFTAIPLVMLSVTGEAGSSDLTSEMPPQFNKMCPGK